jgi:hypothetical protein
MIQRDVCWLGENATASKETKITMSASVDSFLAVILISITNEMPLIGGDK